MIEPWQQRLLEQIIDGHDVDPEMKVVILMPRQHGRSTALDLITPLKEPKIEQPRIEVVPPDEPWTADDLLIWPPS